jgi:hypothetical protein
MQEELLEASYKMFDVNNMNIVNNMALLIIT